MSSKIATVEVAVPYKRAGNVITQHNVSFGFFQEEDHFKLVPSLTHDELLVANLPEELLFEMQDNKPVSLRGLKDTNLHVIQDAVKLLQQEHFL